MIKDLRKYDTKEIKNMTVKLKARLLENRFKLTQGEISNFNIFKETRKVIAQLLTILRERNERLLPEDWKVYSELSEKENNLESSKAKPAEKVKPKASKKKDKVK